jgi:hypothetical protein
MSGTNIKRIIPGNIYSALQNAENASASNPFATILDTNTGNGNQLISGGASYSGTGLDFDVTALEYRIDGVFYNSDPITVTLNAGDPSNGRFDAIVADENLVVSVVTGTPSVSPATPAIGSEQILVQYVLVGANATTPTVTTENVYLESNNGWPAKGKINNPTNTTVDFASSTPTPFQGTECANINSGRYSSNRGIFFSTTSPISRADYVVLSFRVYLTENLNTAAGYPSNVLPRRLIVRVYGDNTGIQTAGNQVGYAYFDEFGLNPALLNTWQLVTIPVSQFVSNPSTVTTMGMCVIGLTGNTTGHPATNYALDDIKFQTGFGPSTNTPTIDILNESSVIADTSKLNFVSLNGTENRIVEDSANSKVDLQINVPGVDSADATGNTLDSFVRKSSTVVVNGQSSDFTVAVPTGTPVDAQKLLFRIKDDGTARSITWNAIFNPVGITLPTTTTANKYLYVGCIYNADSSKWDVIALKQEA